MTNINFTGIARTSLEALLSGVVGGFCYSKWYHLDEKSTISIFMATFFASSMIEQIEALSIAQIKNGKEKSHVQDLRISKIQIICEITDILVLTTALIVGKRLRIFGIITTMIIGGLLIKKLFWIKSKCLTYQKNCA